MLATRSLLAAVFAAVFLAGFGRADDWPQWLGPQRDAVWRETGVLEKFPKDGPKRLWQYDIGAGYAGPAVAGGRVIVHDRVLAPGAKNPDDPFAKANNVKGKERIVCLDAARGTRLWEKDYPCDYSGISYASGPRCTPIIHDGRVYTLGAMGHLQCRDVKTGDVVWEKDLGKDYDADPPLWGFAAHPLIDGDNLITLVGKKPVVVAFDRKTGKERWKALQTNGAEIGYVPPVIYTFGKRRHLIIWHPEAVSGLDPQSGKVLWTHEWPIKVNLNVSMPRQAGDKLFLTAFYNGSLLLEVNGGDSPSAKEVWKSEPRPGKPLSEQPGNTDKLHSIMPTPFIKGGHIYGVCSYGELRCLDLKDGRRVWSDRKATGAGDEAVRWANAFLVAQGERFFLFNEKGELLIAKLSPKGYEEIDRAKLLEPTYQLGGGRFGAPRKVVWSHPAFANKCVFARNDKEVVCYSLAE